MYNKRKKALFHGWTHIKNLIGEYEVGIIEYEDGQVEEVTPENIKFCDGQVEEYFYLDIKRKVNKKCK